MTAKKLSAIGAAIVALAGSPAHAEVTRVDIVKPTSLDRATRSSQVRSTPPSIRRGHAIKSWWTSARLREMLRLLAFTKSIRSWVQWCNMRAYRRGSAACRSD